MKIHVLETDQSYLLLKQRRLDLDLGQVDVANKTGVNQSTIARFERGEIQLEFKNYFALLRALKYNVKFKERKKYTRPKKPSS